MDPHDTCVIPSYVLWKQDTRRLPVCRRAFDYLNERFEMPNLSVQLINPQLYKQNKQLK